MKKILNVFALCFLGFFSPICSSQVTQIDITGNWCEFDAFLPHIQAYEPDVKTDEVKGFKQKLKLPAGKYTLEFRYDPSIDNTAGKALLKNYENFTGFKVNNAVKPLKFLVVPIETNKYSAKYDFELSNGTNDLNLEFSLSATRPLQTLLTCSAVLPGSRKFYGINPSSENKTTTIIHGIPFVLSKLRLENIWAALAQIKDPSPIREWENGIKINCNNIKADAIHFLGMIQQYDIANGSWYSPKGDHSYSHFVGDTTGAINISFTDGKKLYVPLVYGFNFWYGRPWDIIWHNMPYRGLIWGPYNNDAVIFSGQNKHKDIIQNGVKLIDGYRVLGGQGNNARYIFSINLDGKSISSIEISGSDKMKGIPVISAVTIETSQPGNDLFILPDISTNAVITNPVTPGIIEKREYQRGVEGIMHSLYTFVDEHPPLKEPEIPANYFGPRYDFRGTREALYATSYLYKNSLECAAKIGDNGTGCASSTARRALFHYTLSMGAWREIVPVFKDMDNFIKLYHEKNPGELGGKNYGYTRGIGELMREAMAFGYDKFFNTYTDWLDKCLFTDANPPHWNRGIGIPEFPKRSMPIIAGIEERGHRENDGHGICMWGRYMVYHWMGRPIEWNEKRWKATEASVNWIKWQLDTDTIFPGKRKDVLYTESECAHGSYDIYSSYNCLHGLKLCIRMAEQIGKSDKVNEWTKLYDRLRRGILEHLVDSSEFGPIWHTEANCDWKDHAHKLVHLDLSTEGDTYTPLQDYALGDNLDREYLDIDINTYRYLMKDKNYNCLRMYGYGQGMMTQSALLLDQMQDATKFINLMVTYAYLPNLEGWSAPEGIIMHRSGKYYLPVNGYMGQDSHLADSQKALRLMLGIDDNNPEHLRIIPRFPAEWSGMSVSDFPVLTGSKRQKCQYVYARDNDQQSFQLKFEEPVNKFSIRLGPLPAGKKIKKITNNNSKIEYHSSNSGDSQWVWITNLNGKGCEIKIILENLK